MIIHSPKIEKKGDKVRVSAYIEVETKKAYSDILWYEFDKEYEEYISKSLNGFVSAVLFLAMHLGEDIKAEGKMSSKLAYGLKKFQKFFNFWHPKDFKTVQISCDGYEREKKTPEGVMCTFSGGVDSFYTVYEHLPANEDNPNHQITHGLLLDGFALPRTDTLNHSYELIRESYEKLSRKLGIELVYVATNLADFYKGRIPPASIDGPVLASVPLILGRLISTFHIASCLSYSQVLPRGSNAFTNHLLSTEKLTVTIHGSHKSRVEKTEAIANWPETYDTLRVCWEDIGVSNCCKCEKCVRTMITLEAAGFLSKYKTFPSPLSRNKVRTWRLYAKHNFWFAKEIKDYAKFKGRKKIVFDVRYAMARSKTRNIIRSLLRIARRLVNSTLPALKNRSKTHGNG